MSNNLEIIKIGKRVLDLESYAVGQLSQNLGNEFNQAVLRLAQLQQYKGGRVIVSGMGKSGHIGHKIAATLASTGTPAQFVHPAEASHGDLGMITSHDLILALSNSGETAELAALLNYARNHDIDIIAITSNANSTLAQLAKIALILPNIAEASDVALAPTTSTTLCLALGDALAVALMEINGFSPEKFKVFHPGGKLGQQLSQVSDFMHTGSEIPLIQPNLKMRDVLLVMTQCHFGCVGIKGDHDKLIGIITDGDLRRHLHQDNFLDAEAINVMTHNPKVLHSHILASEALLQMQSQKITVYFVVDQQFRPIGIVHIHDFLRADVGG